MEKSNSFWESEFKFPGSLNFRGTVYIQIHNIRMKLYKCWFKQNKNSTTLNFNQRQYTLILHIFLFSYQYKKTSVEKSETEIAFMNLISTYAKRYIRMIYLENEYNKRSLGPDCNKEQRPFKVIKKSRFFAKMWASLTIPWA